MRTAQLGDVCEVVMGQAPAGNSYNEDGHGVLLVAGAGDMKAGRIVSTKYTTAPTKLSLPDDVIIGIRASIGMRAQSPEEVCLGRGVAALRPGPELDRGYLWHWVEASAPRLAAKGRGATFLQVSRRDIAEMRIVVPPLDDQRRIADILDRAAALRAKQRQAIAQLDALTQAIFHDMFGDPAKNARQWPVSTVGAVAHRITDGEHQTPTRTKDGIKLLSARNVRDGYIDFDNVDFIPLTEYERIRGRCDPRRGDLLISCSGTIGRVASVKTSEPFALVRSAALVRPNPELITTGFLEQFLRTPALKARMLQRANASSQANLFQGQIRELPVLLPGLALQKIFTGRAASVDALRTKQAASLLACDALFHSLQHTAFAGLL